MFTTESGTGSGALNSNRGWAMSDNTTFKTESDLQIIGGWFSVFKVDGEDVYDSDNEVIDIASYRKAFVEFSTDYCSENLDHVGQERGTLVDNILIESVDFAKMLVHEITGIPLADIPVQKLGHFGSFQIHEKEDYDNAVANKLMFSIEGRCRREEIGE